MPEAGKARSASLVFVITNMCRISRALQVRTRYEMPTNGEPSELARLHGDSGAILRSFRGY
jgi:hypothetical protein